MKLSNKASGTISVLFLLCAVSYGQTVNGEIIQQQVDDRGNGYSLIKVWGTYAEMGYAHGYLLAEVINAEIASLKKLLGPGYASIKTQVRGSVFPADALEEIDGIIAGTMAKTPSSTVDADDLKVLNTYTDWGYTLGCRSHSCWGSYVSAPVKTLSTRRADYSGAKIAQVVGSIHFLFCAYVPSQTGKIKWLNFGIPGIVISGTGVNEYGTIVSIHDSPSSGDGPPAGTNVLTRSMALRLMMTVDSLPNDISQQLDFVYKALRPYKTWTSSFLNYYAPEGNAGVISGEPARGFHNLRRPQPAYFGGEVIVTSNEQTDGASTPSDFTTINSYYSGTKPKTLADHWRALDVVNTDDGAQLMSVEYRQRGDMTVWARGRLLGTNTTSKIVIEWSDLFGATSMSHHPFRTE
jgi:hypothetical protein